MKNIFIEGIPGMGKSTLINSIYNAIPEFNICREGDYSPVDLAWCTWMTKEEYEETKKRYESIQEDIIKNTVCEGEHYVISYTKVITDIPNFHKELENYEVYNGRKSFEDFKKIIYSRYQNFKDVGYLFECAFFQNIIEDLILFYLMSEDEIVKFYRELYDNVSKDKFLLFYLYSDNLEENIETIKKERSDEAGNELWYEMMIQYVSHSPYGKKYGCSTFEDMIKHFKYRQELEMRIIREVIGDRVVVLPAKEWEIGKVLELCK